MQSTLYHRHWLLFLGFWLLAVAPALAQTISGRITSSDDNQPMPGVSIVIKGTTTGTTSRADGTYSISVPNNNAVLTFSFIGYDNQEVTVGGRSVLNVTLVAATRSLSEVVVTALGISKDAAKIGTSIQTVDATTLIKAREPNAINSLVGKVAGLTIGASSELLGRPVIALRGNTDVLFVVDGIPINSDTWNISNDDIETYTVLKGASASALYGFRGKNGAILITTKRGSKDKRGFEVNVNTSQMAESGFLAIPKVQDQFGPGEYGIYAFGDGKGGGINDGDYDIWGPELNGQLIPQYDSPVSPTQTYTTKFWGGSFTSNRQPTPFVPRGKDNLSRFIQTGIQSNNNISVSSSTDKYDLRFSLSQNYTRGLVPNTSLNVTNFNTSLGFNFTNRLRFESNINYNKQYTPNIPDVQYGPNSLIYNVQIWGGADWNIDDMKQIWQPGKEGVQQIYAEYQRYNNPWFQALYWTRGHYMNNLYGYTSLRYKLTDDLTLTGKTQITTWNLLRNEKFPYSATTYGREEARGDYREDRRDLSDNINQVLLQYNKTFSKNFTVSALAGAELRVFNYKSDYASTNYLNVPGVYSISNSSNAAQASSFASDMQVRSAYYSADFSLGNWATVTTTGRVDQLSTLPKANNTYFYPSVSASTVISDYVKLPAAVSFLKLRASYANVKDALTQSTIGATPTNGSGNPLGYGAQYQSAYGGPTYQNSAVYSTPLGYNNKPAGYYTNTLNNPNLNPSSTSQAEFGLDARFLNNRIAFDAAYFISTEGPGIVSLNQSEATGYTGRLVNAITTQKKGLELSVTGKALRLQNGLTWDVLANWSTYKETLQSVYPDGNVNVYPSSYFVGSSSSAISVNIGDRVDGYYARKLIRTADGQLINDAGGRPIVNPYSQLMGYVNPDFVWGLNNRFGYKNFTFSFQFDGRVGGVIGDYIKQKTYQGGRNLETAQGDYLTARLQDAQGIKSYVGPGVVVNGGAAIKYNTVTGEITNINELTYSPNTAKTFAQDYIARIMGSPESFLISRTYAKLREVVIGYSLPQSLISRLGLRQASISLVGRNLLYFAERTDIDIDQYLSGGISGLQTPTTRRYGVNLNLTF